MGAALDALHKTAKREHLTAEEAAAAMNEILTGEAGPVIVSGLLVALAMKGETVDELVGFARTMRARAAKVPLVALKGSSLVDTCGTGGDSSNSFNISTVSALVVAGVGVPVAKHGNRSISSRCGSADVLEALGVKVDLKPEQVGASIESVGIGFLFAPLIHPAMRHAQPVRGELKMRTVFNMLGPLTNPAGAGAQVVGVFYAKLVPMIAEALVGLGLKRGFVVHGSDGLDEITTTGPTLVAEIADGKVLERQLTPDDFGLRTAQSSDLVGGDREANAAIAREILMGRAGPKRDIVVANAAAALVAAGRAEGFQEAAGIAAESIDSGAAQSALNEFVRFTNQFS